MKTRLLIGSIALLLNVRFSSNLQAGRCQDEPLPGGQSKGEDKSKDKPHIAEAFRTFDNHSQGNDKDKSSNGKANGKGTDKGGNKAV